MMPRIGITTFAGGAVATRNQRYAAAIRAAGGEPVWLEPATLGAASRPDAILDQLHGLFLSGGIDIDPHYFGEPLLENVGVEIDAERDTLELPFTRAALAVEMPILGVCRGIQTLNVAAGGSLYQDLSLLGIGPQVHQQRGRLEAWEPAHPVELVAGSRLAAILGGTHADANSFHHQAVHRLAPELVVTARAPDGVIEGLEHPARRFVVAVQWHPERMVDHDPRQRRLFDAFITAAQR